MNGPRKTKVAAMRPRHRDSRIRHINRRHDAQGPAQPSRNIPTKLQTALPQMQEQPRPNRGRHWQRAHGPQQALEMLGIAQPALGDAFGAKPGQAVAGDEALIGHEAIGGRLAHRAGCPPAPLPPALPIPGRRRCRRRSAAPPVRRIRQRRAGRQPSGDAASDRDRVARTGARPTGVAPPSQADAGDAGSPTKRS